MQEQSGMRTRGRAKVRVRRCVPGAQLILGILVALSPVALPASGATAQTPSLATAATATTGADLCATVAYAAGFRADPLVTAVAVGLAESQCNPSATGTNPPTSGCLLGSRDRGLWQINSCYNPWVTDACAYDAACNARAAYTLSKGGTSWTPWSVYKSGVYMTRMAEARAAVNHLRASSPSASGMGTYQSGSAVGVSSRSTNRLDVFKWGSDQALWHRSWDGSSWSGWASLGGVLTSEPAAVSWGDNRIDVVVRGTDNGLWHKSWAGSWSGWTSLGGVLTSAPAAVSWGDSRLDVFVRGTDNGLWHMWWAGGWSRWESRGGDLTSGPAAASGGDGRLDVFVRGPGDALWRMSWAGWWSGWGSLGGVLTSAPTAASRGAGRVDVFARGYDHALWVRSRDGTWTSWASLGGHLTSRPAAASWSGDRLDVFVRGPDLAMWQKWWDGTWRPWNSLGWTS